MREATVICLMLFAGHAHAAAPVRHVVAPRESVTLNSGDDIQAAVGAHPGGTTFHLSVGLYRIQSVTPKEGDSFIGDDGAILNGANLLTEFDRDGALYVAHNQPIDPNTQVLGVRRKGYPRCGNPQDLYFDGKPLRAVSKKSKVKSGRFFYDYDNDAVYFADDPSGRVVDLSYRPFAFGGPGPSVTVQNLIVENYACADQQGAIGDHAEGKQWEILDNEVRWNHGVGIVVPPGTQNLPQFRPPQWRDGIRFRRRER